jgi:hypothetical protein
MPSPAIENVKVKRLEGAELAAERESKKRDNGMAFAILYAVMGRNMTITMEDTSIQTKNFLATQAQASKINDMIAALPLQNLLQNEIGLLKIGDGNKVAADATMHASVTYWATYQGQYVKGIDLKKLHEGMNVSTALVLTNNFANAWGFAHQAANTIGGLEGNAGMSKLQNLNFYRKAQAFDYQGDQMQNDVITAQHDYFQAKQSGLTQDETVIGGNISSDGNLVSNQLNVIDNVANLMTKLGDEGANQ